MKSMRQIGLDPASLPLAADDILEFHAARVLLLLRLCGVSGRRIDSLTKFAKLDFFVRYPDFFEVAKRHAETRLQESPAPLLSFADPVESAMVRHHYGPWDKRYYHVLASLEARGLITVEKKATAYRIALTDAGEDRATQIEGKESFKLIADRAREVKRVFGSKSGSQLKALIYKVFDQEVGQRRLGEVIQ